MKTVLVNRKTAYDRKGMAKLVPADQKVYGIVTTYDDGRVKTTSGDVWCVKPLAGNQADFIVSEAAVQ